MSGKRSVSCSVHPHACGEHFECEQIHCRAVGSSPRLWGTSLRRSIRPIRRRFIPTPVGNIYGRLGSGLGRPVHPHACGEHFAAASVVVIYPGSSPRLWGTLLCDLNGFICNRFIPTPVGNMMRASMRGVNLTVHPHACGEHSATHTPTASHTGSSPRLWGTLSRRRIRRPISRFIPTPVGNIPTASVTSSLISVHPHACGEHNCRCPRCHGLPRFIPTPVGNITATIAQATQPPVHPHACGEHFSSIFVTFPLTGSSPRLWGTY